MAKETKYGIPSLKRDFPNDEACIEFVFDALHSRGCSCGGAYSLMSNGEDADGRAKIRRKFQCSKCRYKISPTAGTIFHKSDTPLILWFQAILLFSNAKSGISAKMLERELEVTYKCAYRILTQIRRALKQDERKLRGDVEIDTGFFGGKGYAGKNNERQGEVMERKAVVIVAAERGGRIRAEVAKNAGSIPMAAFIERNIEKRATSIITDGSLIYRGIAKVRDFHTVDHKRRYVQGDIHINTVETFFSHLKRSFKGTYKAISQAKLQSYLDAFVFHYNNRHNDRERFGTLLGTVLHA